MRLTTEQVDKWEMFCEISGRFMLDGMSIEGADRATFNLLFKQKINIRELHYLRRKLWHRERKVQ